MATTTIPVRIGPASSRDSAVWPRTWLRVAVGTLVAAMLIIGLLAAAGRLLPPHPEWAVPTSGTLVETPNAG